MTVYCVIVTHNRLALLQECLQAVYSQSRRPDRILVVDNYSTDNTPEYLDYLWERGEIELVRTASNIGGAGGFSLGLKEAVRRGADCTWLMDDDTIPDEDCLRKMLAATTQQAGERIGFVASRVRWIDGSDHMMNRVALLGRSSAQQDEQAERRACASASFVSLLVSTPAVRAVGLPIAEFFLWCDDLEFTQRITDAGFANYYVPGALTLHKTQTNYYPAIDSVPVAMAGRFYYQARNSLYIKWRTMRYKWLFPLVAWNKLRIYKHRIARRPPEEREAFLEAVRQGCRDGLSFRPVVETIGPEAKRKDKHPFRSKLQMAASHRKIITNRKIPKPCLLPEKSC